MAFKSKYIYLLYHISVSTLIIEHYVNKIGGNFYICSANSFPSN